MTWTNERFGIGSVVRPMGLLLLILLFVFQIVAPAAAASTSATDRHAHHQGMAEAVVNCPMHIGIADANMDGAVGHDGAHEDAAHCMPLMCCFHDTVSAYKLVAVGMLLPGAQIIDRGKAASSNVGSTQERPPRQV